MLIEAALAEGASAAKYGPLGDMVTGAGFLLAAALALRLGWMRRSGSYWVPPDEAVPKATTRVALLVTAVLLALLYVFLSNPGRKEILAAITLLFLILAVIGLLSTTHIMRAYGVEVERTNRRGKKVKSIKLGGKRLTSEAERIKRTRRCSVDRLVQEAQGELTLVFERSSLAGVHTTATAMFLLLQVFGSLALGAAGLLLGSPGGA